MSKTIKQALKDEITYPLNDGFMENKLLARGLNADGEITPEIIKSNEFIGATADCLFALITAPNISEAGKSISLGDRGEILKVANRLYASIGEDEKTIDVPTVQFGFGRR